MQVNPVAIRVPAAEGMTRPRFKHDVPKQRHEVHAVPSRLHLQPWDLLVRVIDWQVLCLLQAQHLGRTPATLVRWRRDAGGLLAESSSLSSFVVEMLLCARLEPDDGPMRVG